MRLNEVITRLIVERDFLESKYGYDTGLANPTVILSSDEEGNSYHNLVGWETLEENDFIVLFPGGYELEEL